MFSTPQSKAFFSQQIIKGKLIVQQIQLVTYISDRTWSAKSSIAELLKFLYQQDRQDEHSGQQIQEKINKIEELIEGSYQMINESNQQFQFQVSLRADIKSLEHSFFKSVMIFYEEKIKELKHCLLLLENDVQNLEQKGMLPYVQNPKRNNILTSKSKNFIQYKQNLEIMNRILTFVPLKRLQNIVISLVDTLLHKKQAVQPRRSIRNHQRSKTKSILETEKIPPEQFDKSFEIKDGQSKVQEVAQPEKSSQSNNNSLKNRKQQHTGIYDMLKILKNWGEVVNFKLNQSKRSLKEKIQALSHKNKVLKEGIRNYKKIMKYEENESNVRYGQIQLTREQAIDFLNEMNEDLQRRFTRRNIYMVISLYPQNKQTKSSTDLTYLKKSQTATDTEICLKQVDTNLNNSFLDQCSYLISDRFIVDEDQNQEVIV